MRYAIYKNGRIIKTGERQFKSELDEELFELKMKQKYMTSDDDLVEVWYR